MKKAISGWGNYPKRVSILKNFDSTQELEKQINNPKSTIARGLGRSYGDASLSPNIISTLKLNNILSFNDSKGLIKVESGISVEDLLKFIVPRGWFMPVTAGTKFITLGGAIASNIHGKNHHKEGSIIQFVNELEIVTGPEKIITCSPTKNSDLFYSSFGGMGLTGIITKVELRLKKIETSFISQTTIKSKNLNETIDLFIKNKSVTYSVAWIDCLAKGEKLGRGVFLMGEHAKKSELDSNREPLQTFNKTILNFPLFLPSFFLNKITISLFNFCYYNLRKEKDSSITDYDSFFYPLDKVTNWNRAYGKKGFIQYQFVLPLTKAEILHEILVKVAKSGQASFLAVLKIFGKEENYLSFPMEGFTLAMDFPVRESVFELIKELDEIIHKHGGRIYLTKDSIMKEQYMKKGYPLLPKFLGIVEKYTKGEFKSDLSERLGIRI